MHTISLHIWLGHKGRIPLLQTLGNPGAQLLVANVLHACFILT